MKPIAMVTGADGFVGRHLIRKLLSCGYDVIGTSRSPHQTAHDGAVIQLSLDHSPRIAEVLNRYKPDVIFHLAGESSVRRSWNDIRGTFQSNVMASINLLEAVRMSDIVNSVKIITVGSSEEYGIIPDHVSTIDETLPLQPVSPYGVSKASLSMLVKQYAGVYGLSIVHARPFNHIGPGQSLGFVTTDFAHQIVQIEKGLREPVLKVGNLSAKRDFLDVRDIAEAYVLLAEHGRKGEVYNICSGVLTEIQSVLAEFLQMACVNIRVERDPALYRPVESRYVRASNRKIREHTGWTPKIDLRDSLRDILDYFRQQ
jgi:GDP-4-dehydro-6-deoxy-D-mannose reductase